MRNIFLSLLLAAVVCSSCSINKRVTQPDLNLPESLIPGLAQPDTLSLADMKWMEFFADSMLLNLIDSALTYNKDMLIASARIREYEQRHRIKRSELFPTIGIDIHADRETTTKSPGSDAVEEIELSAVATLSWELDLFGRLRWGKKEAMANYLKTIEARRALQMTLISEVATSYIELVALDKELSIVESTLTTRRENMAKAKLRFEGGLTSEIPYQQAQVEFARTAAMIPDLRHKIKQKENEISFLTGGYPSSVERASVQNSLAPIPELHVGLPSDLIERRPDVRAAKNSFESSIAKVGISWANRFPRFVIDLEAGFEHTEFKGFFSAPWTHMVGSIAGPVFSFGKRKAEYEAQLAACEAECYAYEECVLQAFREVSDAVDAYNAAVENTQQMETLMHSSHKYVELALFQHINGHISYMDVLDAQRSYFSAEIQHSNATRDQYLALIHLYKALGGGWQ